MSKLLLFATIDNLRNIGDFVCTYGFHKEWVPAFFEEALHLGNSCCQVAQVSPSVFSTLSHGLTTTHMTRTYDQSLTFHMNKPQKF
jgi:hypothetical protein